MLTPVKNGAPNKHANAFYMHQFYILHTYVNFTYAKTTFTSDA